MRHLCQREGVRGGIRPVKVLYIVSLLGTEVLRSKVAIRLSLVPALALGPWFVARPPKFGSLCLRALGNIPTPYLCPATS